MFRFARKAHLQRRPRGRRYWLLVGTGAVLIIGALAWQLNATLWLNHSNRVGSSLVKGEQKLQKSAISKGSCSPGSTASSVAGLLEAPKIALTAPVEQGTTDAVLNVAVGHDASSVWPGTDGTAVFNAHDVSYFLNIDHLSAGDRLVYQTACTEYDFVVQGHAVVKAGSPVYNTPGPSVTLVTCWPTNALWFTPDRYVVTAVEVDKRSLVSRAPVLTSLVNTTSPPTVNAPAALMNQGLSLTTNYAPMGSMTLAGSPSQAFTQSPGPLNMEFSALEAYFGAIKSLGQDQLGWWQDLAPGLRPPTPLLHATVAGYASSLDVTVNASGDVPSGVAFHTDVHITGGASPGQYSVAVGFAIAHGQLTISSWNMTRS